MTYEEIFEKAAVLDSRYESLIVYIAESMTKKQLDDEGGLAALREDVHTALFELNVEFDLDIKNAEFWKVEIDKREDGCIHVDIVPRAVADIIAAGEKLTMVECEPSHEARRYQLYANRILCTHDSYFMTMILLGKFLESGGLAQFDQHRTALGMSVTKKMLN
jgi:hypothetical protein